MGVKTFWTATWFSLMGMLIFWSCVNDRNFSSPEKACTNDMVANITFSEVKALHTMGTLQIQDDLIIEGYVISSDKSGNFFGSLYFQDQPSNPTGGFIIVMDVRDSHLFYPTGTKILVRLKGLYLGRSKGVFKIGAVFSSFGNLSVGRLPASAVSQHIFVDCSNKVSLEPVPISLESLGDAKPNTLVRLENVEISEDEIGLPFANFQELTERTLINCKDTNIGLLNSGYADFQSEILPQGSGSLIGVLLKENDDYLVVIRDLDDIDFKAGRCAELIDEFSSNTIFISELADPDNNSKARFVELYNSNIEPLSLKGWMLNRFTNANSEISATVNLSNHIINAESALLISPNASEFEAVYGFPPDVGVGTNSPADSNGDDNLQLIDPFGKVIDTFGVIGEDGSGTNHEFEDGRAIRNPDITQANATYTFDEWTIYNDSGGSGTIKQPLNSPENFTPGNRN